MYWSVLLIALSIMFSEGNSISTLYGKGIEGNVILKQIYENLL